MAKVVHQTRKESAQVDHGLTQLVKRLDRHYGLSGEAAPAPCAAADVPAAPAPFRTSQPPVVGPSTASFWAQAGVDVAVPAADRPAQPPQVLERVVRGAKVHHTLANGWQALWPKVTVRRTYDANTGDPVTADFEVQGMKNKTLYRPLPGGVKRHSCSVRGLPGHALYLGGRYSPGGRC